ncbi:ammonium transporter [Thermospira aquatica]|uniref:Ammonium transporter n=1 Tax=Thermospira aquatica TaxID=2828656 RepID=A0AAX3BGW6_9SPIR|nr:ammonium transporter [Thermospira aquatica]URA11243.1 ammonium transporter [Thermospira aquatica]
MKRWFWVASGILLGVSASFAQESADITRTLSVALDTVWVLLTGLLVFFMNTGFAMVEAGLARAKNTVNILAKNFIVFALASLAYWVIGWGLMFGDGNGFIGLTSLFFANGGVDEGYSAISWTQVPFWAKFFFQLVFAGTAATIVSGAVAERIKFLSFLVFSVVLVGFIYPIIGHWIWGGGWLQELGMWDFAGSTVVHSVGGWAALAGVLLLGPRTGKYRSDGSINPIMGHNLSLVTLGGLILWFGWFGFNPGSTMGVGDGTAIAHIFMTTNTSAIMAILSAMATSWILQKKPDLTMLVNGALAGLVAITAPCAFVSVPSAAIIGLIAGILVVLSVFIFDRLRIDDPVGALSVHLVNGVFGTLAVGLFAQNGITGTETTNGLFFGGGVSLFLHQLIGVLVVAAFVFTVALIVWAILKATIGIRVTREEELLGLDLGEHGQEAYPDFQGFLTK